MQRHQGQSHAESVLGGDQARVATALGLIMECEDGGMALKALGQKVRVSG